MKLNLLAPDIQEEILFLPRVQSGRDRIREHAIRHIAATADWGKQRRMWEALLQPSSGECRQHETARQADRITGQVQAPQVMSLVSPGRRRSVQPARTMGRCPPQMDMQT